MRREINGNRSVHELIAELEKTGHHTMCFFVGDKKFQIMSISEIERIKKECEEYDLVIG